MHTLCSGFYAAATSSAVLISPGEGAVLRVLHVMCALLAKMMLRTFIIAVIMWPYFGLISYARQKPSVVQV